MGGCLLQGLDIAKDRTVVPNQYLVLRFDFSSYSGAINETINETINGALRRFFRTYLPYFKVKRKKSATKLVDQLINEGNCASSLIECVQFIEDQLRESKTGKHPLKDIKGVGAHCFVLG